jgi:hypothetical protein
MRPPYHEFEGIRLAEEEAYLRKAHSDCLEISIQAALALYDVDEDRRIRSRLSWDRHQQIIRAIAQKPDEVSEHLVTLLERAQQ